MPATLIRRLALRHYSAVSSTAPDVRYLQLKVKYLLPAYAAACATSVNVTVAPASIRLTLPANWDGPASLPLSTGVAVLAVGVGAFFGVSAIFILSNL
jgi:hypothetical protein